jgi:hypothetical protein
MSGGYLRLVGHLACKPRMWAPDGGCAFKLAEYADPGAF